MGDTHGHYSKRYLVVSDTQPNNPVDGLLWFDPLPCETTTTTEEPVTTTTEELVTTTTTIEPVTTTTTLI
jgi:hypothetical protein